MIWWVTGGIVVASLVLLGLAIRPLLQRREGLDRAVRRLQRRAEEAQGLQARAETLAQRLEDMQEQAAAVQERAELLKAKRGD